MGDKGKDKAMCEDSQTRIQCEGIACRADSHITTTDICKTSKFPGKNITKLKQFNSMPRKQQLPPIQLSSPLVLNPYLDLADGYLNLERLLGHPAQTCSC